MLSNIECLGLEMMPCALLSYVMLIEFVYDHNPMLLRRVSPPDIFSSIDRLVLSTSTVDQLNVAGTTVGGAVSKGGRTSGKNTLFDVVNRCSTNAGKRLLMRRILAPSFDADDIDSRYNLVEEFGRLFNNNMKEVNCFLDKIVDIERLQRRMLVGIMTPAELASLVISYDAVVGLDTLLKRQVRSTTSECNRASCMKDVLMDSGNLEATKKFVGICRYAFDIDSMLACDASFNKGVFKELDELGHLIQLETDSIRNIAFSIGIDCPRIEHTSSMGHYISVTSSQAKSIKTSQCTKKNGLAVKSNSASSRITSPKIEAASRNIVALSERLKASTQKCYKKTLEYLLRDSKIFTPVVRFVSEVDVVKSNYVTSTCTTTAGLLC